MNYIQYYDDIMKKDLCEELIDKFENSSEHYDVRSNRTMDFTQINLVQNKKWNKYVNPLSKIFSSCIERYKSDCNVVGNMWPKKYGFEEFRLKRYLPNGVDEFRNHVDVTRYATARRFLVFFLYLDDNKMGHTTFPQMDISVQPKAGRMLMFPPMWTHLHAGTKPIEKPKYIIGSYLHYV
tara:strand:- start:58 stop:597 length:540 start_codon:yes stop_codon:yes gene_type:complete